MTDKTKVTRSTKEHLSFGASRIAFCAGAAFVLTATMTGPVFAQAPPQSDANDEIVVTARRKAENLERVPAAVTVLNSEQLDMFGVHSEADLQRVSPGLVVREAISNNQLNYAIRGQTIDAYTSSPPGVLPYFNEVQITNSNATSFYDLSSVQVLKGPQGTLFGRNTTGGAVLFTTATPTDNFESAITLRLGDYSRREVEGFVNIPLIEDKLLLRMAGNVVRRDGYVTNLMNGEDLGRQRSESGRVSLRVRPDSRLQNDLAVQYSDTGGTNLGGAIYSLTPVGTPGTSSAAAAIYGPLNPYFADYLAGNPYLQRYPGGISEMLDAQRARGPFEVELNSPAFFRGESWWVTNTTAFNINPNLTLKNIAGWARSEVRHSVDGDGSPYNLYNYGPFADIANSYGQVNHNEQMSEELQLQGTALDQKLDFILGGYVSREEFYTYFDQVFFDLSPVAPGPSAPMELEQTTESQAIFAQGSYDLSSFIEGLTFTGGLRYTWVQVNSTELPRSAFFGGPVTDTEFEEPSWTIGFEYQATQDLLLYITNRHSWRAGGFNGFTYPYDAPAAEGGSFFSSEIVDDIEIGAKFRGDAFGFPLRLNVAAFDLTAEDVQRVVYIALPSGLASVTANVPEARISGAEMDTQLDLAHWFRIGGTASYMDARFTEDTVVFFGVPTTFGPYPDTPRYSGSIFAEADLPIPAEWGTLTLHGDVYAQSETFFSSGDNTYNPGSRLPGYEVANFRLDWSGIAGSNVSAAMFVTNAFDETYYSGGLQTGSAFGLNTAIPAKPRMFGAEITISF